MSARPAPAYSDHSRYSLTFVLFMRWRVGLSLSPSLPPSLPPQEHSCRRAQVCVYLQRSTGDGVGGTVTAVRGPGKPGMMGHGGADRTSSYTICPVQHMYYGIYVYNYYMHMYSSLLPYI